MEAGTENRDGRFLALVNENRLRILKVCHVYAWNREDQEDIYQEILFQIWRSLPNLKDSAYTSTWLYRIALNTAISFVRKHASRQKKTVNFEHGQIQELMDAKISHDTNPQLHALYEAISKLDAMEKAAITLFLEDLNYEQIAEVTGLTSSNVGVTLHRAKKKLSALMEDSRHE